MLIKEYRPQGVLASYVNSYQVISTENQITKTVLPETSPLLALRYEGRFDYIIHNRSTQMPALALAGLRSSVKQVYMAKNTGVFLVKFKELAIASFFKEPLHCFFEKGIAVDDLSLKQNISGVEEQLYKAKDDSERILAVEKFLISLLKQQGTDQLISAALQKIMAVHGNIKIKELARVLNISMDAFEKRFRRIVGVSPKRFSTLVRMKYAIKNKTAAQSVTDMALTLGYFDESHFIKDFKLFSGQTPFQYFAATR